MLFRSHELERVQEETVDLLSLKKVNIIPQQVKRAKVIASGKLTKALKIKGLAVTKGARVAIEAVGGTIEL